MNICIFIKKPPSGNKVGGLETQNKILAEGLTELGHKVAVIETGSVGGDEPSFVRFKTSCRKAAFDLVISQSAAGAYYIKHSKSKIPFIVIQHGTLFGEIKTRFREIPNLYQLLFFIFRIIPYGIKAYIKYDFRRLLKADMIIAVSDQIKESMRYEYPFVQPSKVKVIYNGEDISKFSIKSRLRETINREIRSDLGIGVSDPVLIFVGHLFRSKGVHILVDAVERLKDSNVNIKLIVLGDGPEFDNIKAIVERKGLNDEIKLLGYISYAEIPKYYNSADIFVLPTLRDEGLPMSLIQASFASLPLVASNIGGIPSIVKDNSNGILVDSGNTVRLVEAIKKLVNDPNLRVRMGENSFKFAKAKFSQEAMVQEYNKVIQELVMRIK